MLDIPRMMQLDQQWLIPQNLALEKAVDLNYIISFPLNFFHQIVIAEHQNQRFMATYRPWLNQIQK